MGKLLLLYKKFFLNKHILRHEFKLPLATQLMLNKQIEPNSSGRRGIVQSLALNLHLYVIQRYRRPLSREIYNFRQANIQEVLSQAGLKYIKFDQYMNGDFKVKHRENFLHKLQILKQDDFCLEDEPTIESIILSENSQMGMSIIENSEIIFSNSSVYSQLLVPQIA